MINGASVRRFFSILCLVIAILILLGWIALIVVYAWSYYEVSNDPAASGIDYLPIYLGMGSGTVATAVFGIVFASVAALLAKKGFMKMLAYILVAAFIVGSYLAIMLLVI